MEFRWTIIYVRDVKAAVSFYEAAFALKRRMITGEGDYAEMETGSTRLAFASIELAKSHLPDGVVPHSLSDVPQALELAFVTADVDAGFKRALKAGATAILQPKKMPWGQTVSWVRDPDGVLIEVASEA